MAPLPVKGPTPIQRLRGLNANVTILPDRVIVERKNISSIKFNAVDALRTIKLAEVTAVIFQPDHGRDRGLIKIMTRGGGTESMWILYHRKYEPLAREIVDHIRTLAPVTPVTERPAQVESTEDLSGII